VMFYLGGMRLYRERLAEETALGFPGFLSNTKVLTPA
jgi:hypothetical protein